MAIQFDNTNTGVATLRPATSGTLNLTLPSADGTTGQALTTDGAGQLAFTTVGGGGGLTGFTAAESTTAPNDTVNVDSLTASAASTNADVAFVAKGTGATLAQVPTSTTAGGNKRGTYATDFQKSRNSSSQVASGNFSSILGGQNNRASGTGAAVGGGTSNTASQTDSSVFGGSSNTASNQASIVAGGTFNTASGVLSGVFAGENNSASGEAAVAVGGAYHTVNALSATIVGGRFGTARSIVGNYVVPASYTPIAVAAGCSQTTTLVLGRQTTTATATVLTSNSFAASTTNQVILPNNSAYYFKGSITSGVTGGGASAMWTFEGGIKRGANAASTTIIQSVINPVAADTGASSWIVALSADTTNGGLAVTVTGQAATTIRWVCKIETTEMTF